MTSDLNLKDLILVPKLTTDEMDGILNQYRLRDVRRADRNLQTLTGEPPLREAFAEIVGNLLRAVADSLNLDAALNNF